MVRSGQGHCRAHNKKLLRWICEVTKLDRIWNERIRDGGTESGRKIAMEVQDRMRNWYGHMMRREEHCVGRMTMEM